MSEQHTRDGSKRIWFESNPLELLRKVMIKNPKASEKEIFDAFCNGLDADESFFGMIVSYWFANHYRKFSIVQSSDGAAVSFHRNGKPQVSLTEAKKARAKDRMTVNRIKESMRAVLMDFVLSNGKKLRESTFGDCAHDGGWLLTVAKQGRANEIVGKKLTERNLQDLRLRALAKKAA